MKTVTVFEPGDEFATLTARGEARLWKVIEDGTLTCTAGTFPPGVRPVRLMPGDPE